MIAVHIAGQQIGPVLASMAEAVEYADQAQVVNPHTTVSIVRDGEPVWYHRGYDWPRPTPQYRGWSINQEARETGLLNG